MTTDMEHIKSRGYLRKKGQTICWGEKKHNCQPFLDPSWALLEGTSFLQRNLITIF